MILRNRDYRILFLKGCPKTGKFRRYNFGRFPIRNNLKPDFSGACSELYSDSPLEINKIVFFVSLRCNLMYFCSDKWMDHSERCFPVLRHPLKNRIRYSQFRRIIKSSSKDHSSERLQNCEKAICEAFGAFESHRSPKRSGGTSPSLASH